MLNEIEESLNPKPAADPKLSALREENKKLHDEVRILSILASRYQEELRNIRETEFLIPSFRGRS